MVDTSTSLTPATAHVSGTQTITASAALFAATDVGRALAIYLQAGQRAASTAYAVGVTFWASYAGVNRLYRVLVAGTTAAYSSSGTTPDYDLNAPREAGITVVDGSCILKYLGQGKHVWGFGTITAYTDSTHVTVDVAKRGPFAAVAASTRWKLGEWSNARGWPRAMTFHDGRTFWGGSGVKPQTIWAGQSGDYENMTPTEPDGTVLDTNAITVTLDDDTINTVRWMCSVPRGLVIGAQSGEFLLAPANANGALAPGNIRVRRQTDRGSDAAPGHARANGVVLFVQRGGRKLRQLEYDFGTDSFTTADMTELADHVAGAGFVEAAYQSMPDGMWWGVRQDGTLATFTFDREQRVRGWSRQILGGADAVVESVAIVPSPDGTSEDVYLSVTRTINGATVRTIECIRAPFRADIDGASGGFFVDCGLTYSGTAATTFSGLSHLEGETVQLAGDGSVRQDKVVTAGTVTATGPASAVMHIGLPYTSTLVTLPPEAGAAAGSAQGAKRRIHEISIRFADSAGGEIGRNGAYEAIVMRDLSMAMSEAVPLFTGVRRLTFPPGWDNEGQVTIRTRDPLPMTVVAIISDLETNG